jgi:hypothetical protein
VLLNVPTQKALERFVVVKPFADNTPVLFALKAHEKSKHQVGQSRRLITDFSFFSAHHQ